MKKLIYLFIVIIIASCKNETVKSSVETMEKIESDIELNDDLSLNENTLFNKLAEEKLQELYDLLVLKNEHPEFESFINKQLNTYIKDSSLNKTVKEGLIKNVTLNGDFITISDSVQKVKLHYDIVSKNKIQKDSIWAILTNRKLEIDGKPIKSIGIIFDEN